MELPETLIEDIRKEATSEFQSVYDEFVYPSDQVKFQDFLGLTIKDILEEFSNLIEVTTDNVYLYQKRINVTKKRWQQKEISEKLELYKEVEIVAKSLFEDLLQNNEEEFEKLYGCRNPKELKKKRIEELEEWIENQDTPLSHYKYIKTKTKRQIVSALTNDIKYLFYKKVFEEYPRGKQSIVTSIPYFPIPIDPTNKLKLKTDQVIEEGSKKYYLDKYYISDTTILESRMNVEVLKTGMLQQVMKWLNQRDIEIFGYIMSIAIIDESFLATREIIVDIGDIVRKVYPRSDGNYAYMSVKESLYRMQYLNSGLVDGSLRGFTTKLLDNVNIYYDEETGKETARIVINMDMVNEYIKNNVISTYSEVIENFKNPASKIGIFHIQRERVRIANNTPSGQKLTFDTTYNFFRGILLFSNKKKRTHIQRIEDMLDEFVENEIAVEGYERKGDMFRIEFLPISEQEKRDLLDEQGFQKIIGESHVMIDSQHP